MSSDLYSREGSRWSCTRIKRALSRIIFTSLVTQSPSLGGSGCGLTTRCSRRRPRRFAPRAPRLNSIVRQHGMLSRGRTFVGIGASILLIALGLLIFVAEGLKSMPTEARHETGKITERVASIRRGRFYGFD